MRLLARRAWGLLPAAALTAGCATDPGGGGDDGGNQGDDDGGPGTITVKVFPEGVPSPTGATGNADLLAFQDGDGDWTAATGSDGVYPIVVHAERYAVAVGCRGAGTAFYYQSVAEAGQLAVRGCLRPADTATIEIKATGDESSLSEIWIGDAVTFGQPGAPSTLNVDKGPQDIFARGFEPTFGGDVGVRVYRGAALDIEADQRISIDWSQARPVATFPLTITGASPAGLWAVEASYLVPHGHGFRTVADVFGAATTYATLPPQLRQPGDVVRVEASETINLDSRSPDPLLVLSAFQELATTPGPVTLARADRLEIPPPIIDTNAVSQLSVTLPIPSSKLGFTRSSASFTTPIVLGLNRRQDMFVRPGWAAGASTVTLTVPDLRNLAGWTTDMELLGRTEVDWSLSVADQDQPFDAPVGDRRGVACTVIGKTAIERLSLVGGAP